jgi:hypothetical protein
MILRALGNKPSLQETTINETTLDSNEIRKDGMQLLIRYLTTRFTLMYETITRIAHTIKRVYDGRRFRLKLINQRNGEHIENVKIIHKLKISK